MIYDTINDAVTIPGKGEGTILAGNGTPMDISIGDGPTLRSDRQESLGRIDQYELLKELGGGGFGTVYLARDTVSGVDVAVKGLPPLVKGNREEMENIRSNFALVSRLHHPNIAAALVLHPAKEVAYAAEDVRRKLRVDSGDTLMVMEYAPGVTLSKWRRQFPGGIVPFAEALEITRQVAAALDYAHERKIVHRDVKPANVMVETAAGGAVTARVLDFGLAAEVRSSMGRVSREIHDTSGTRPYMAPEQWGGDRQGPATDQYALAATFYELVAGHVPFANVFETGDPMIMMTVVATRQPEIPGGIPAPARNALARAFAKKPEERFASCCEFVEALKGKNFSCVEHVKRVDGDGRAGAPHPPVGSRVPRDRNVAPQSGGPRPVAAVKGVLVAALVAALAGGVWYYRHQEQNQESARIAAEQKAESERKAKVARRAKAEAERKAEEERKKEAERLAKEKAEEERKAEDERKAVEERVRRAAEAAARNAAIEIRIEANFQKANVERISDADGFKAKKDALAGSFDRADSFFDEKVRRWSEAAFLFTNYVNECKALIALDGERQTAVAKRAEAQDASRNAEDAGAKTHAATHWAEAVGMQRNADARFKEMDFAAAGNGFESAAKQFMQCSSEAKAEKRRIADEKARLAKEKDERESKEAAERERQVKLKEMAEREAEVVRIKNLMAAAHKYFDAQKWQECICECDKILASDPSNDDAYSLKAAAEDHLVPSLKLMATINGREASNAKIVYGNIEYSLPYSMKLVANDRLGPFKISCEEGNRRWFGTFDEVTVDWLGPKTIKVALKEYKGPQHGDTMTLTLPGGETMEMIYCGPGEYVFGMAETPMKMDHGFWLGKYEVTQRQWESVMGGGRSSFTGEEGEELPAENVSWDDCQDFVQRVSAAVRYQLGGEARLPKEAEWEYACRAGTTGAYSGNGSLDDMGWYNKNCKINGKMRTHGVGKKMANDWGFHDMHGNVSEWCDDARGADRRVLRGGSWNDSADWCRSAYSFSYNHGDRTKQRGFRLCCSAGPH